MVQSRLCIHPHKESNRPPQGPETSAWAGAAPGSCGDHSRACGGGRMAPCCCARLCCQARLSPASLKERMCASLCLLLLSVWGEVVGPVCGAVSCNSKEPSHHTKKLIEIPQNGTLAVHPSGIGEEPCWGRTCLVSGNQLVLHAPHRQHEPPQRQLSCIPAGS